jgi:hypothetical protein
VDICWGDHPTARELLEKWQTDRLEFWERTAKHRSAIGKTSAFLKSTLGVELRARRAGRYELRPATSFLLIEICPNSQESTST